jgi:hypothetical protein
MLTDLNAWARIGASKVGFITARCCRDAHEREGTGSEQISQISPGSSIRRARWRKWPTCRFRSPHFPRKIAEFDARGEAVKLAIAVLSLSMPTALPQQAAAWGDDGHKVVALIAERYLTPTAKKQVDALLAADTDPLTQHDIASEATWADRYRDANYRKDNYDATKRWHFVDLEITDPDMTKGCYGREPLPPGAPASVSDKMACVVDKVAQFATELEAPGTDAEERLFALKFLLHFVGDMHQPLHASDNGGNSVKVMVDGFTHGQGRAARLLGQAVRRSGRQAAGDAGEATACTDHPGTGSRMEAGHA